MYGVKELKIMDKLKIRQTIIVEGKYDKIKLSAVVDAVIICTNGFGIFNDQNKADLIRHYASNTGIIILTDSDHAGMRSETISRV
jgi:ribonuclease M5